MCTSIYEHCRFLCPHATLKLSYLYQKHGELHILDARVQNHKPCPECVFPVSLHTALKTREASEALVKESSEILAIESRARAVVVDRQSITANETAFRTCVVYAHVYATAWMTSHLPGYVRFKSSLLWGLSAPLCAVLAEHTMCWMESCWVGWPTMDLVATLYIGLHGLR